MSGKISIENDVRIAENCTVLKNNGYSCPSVPCIRQFGYRNSGLMIPPAFIPQKPLYDEGWHVRISSQASSVFSRLPWMHLHMPSEAHCQEDCGINPVLKTGITVSSRRIGGTISAGLFKTTLYMMGLLLE